MLSKSQIKLITSLQLKKYRNQHGLFFVEGKKTVAEFLKSNYELVQLYALHTADDLIKVPETIGVSSAEMKKISALKTPSDYLGVFRKKNNLSQHEKGLIVALDDIRDPGNLGTIIRLCDWFGVHTIWCSSNTVDCYNPKVIQATMGSLTRVTVNYLDLPLALSESNKVIYGTYMDGDNVYASELIQDGIVVLGNEANGISDAIATLITKKISIPRFGELLATESLNVATATAIVLSEFKRRTLIEK